MNVHSYIKHNMKNYSYILGEEKRALEEEL